MLTVIIPTLNSAKMLSALLTAVAPVADEIIISDGGSTDESLRIAAGHGARICAGGPGRGLQLSRAAGFCRAQKPDDWLLFLHADSIMPEGLAGAVQTHMMAEPDRAGYFQFKLDDKGAWPRVVESLVKDRCWWFALPYGDQGLLVRRDVYRAAGGYPDWPLFEDVKLVRRLGRRRLKLIDLPITTCPSKYKRDGYKARTFKNLGLLIRFLVTGKPNGLAERYQ